MPYKNAISGIYSITTPSGSLYIGSSNSIHRRWSEHKRNLRNGTHHSVRLQAAWNKHKDALVFQIIEVCPVEDLELREQHYILSMKANLNTTQYVNNVWCNPETREKLASAFAKKEWRNARSEIAKRVVAAKRIPVDCSDGRTFESMHAAAQAIGVKAAQVKAWCITQRMSEKYGLRFKYASAPWRDVLPKYEQAVLTRKMNGHLHHTEETKAKLRAAKANFVPSNKGIPHTAEAKARIAMAQKRIEVVDATTGLLYQSCVEASRKTGVSRTQVRRLLKRGERFFAVASPSTDSQYRDAA